MGGARGHGFGGGSTANPANGYGPDFALRSLSSVGAVAAFSHATSAAACLLARARCNDLPPVPAHLPQNYILTGPAFLFSPTVQFTLASSTQPAPRSSTLDPPSPGALNLRRKCTRPFPRSTNDRSIVPSGITFNEKLCENIAPLDRAPAFVKEVSFS